MSPSAYRNICSEFITYLRQHSELGIIHEHPKTKIVEFIFAHSTMAIAIKQWLSESGLSNVFIKINWTVYVQKFLQLCHEHNKF